MKAAIAAAAVLPAIHLHGEDAHAGPAFPLGIVQHGPGGRLEFLRADQPEHLIDQFGFRGGKNAVPPAGRFSIDFGKPLKKLGRLRRDHVRLLNLAIFSFVHIGAFKTRRCGRIASI